MFQLDLQNLVCFASALFPRHRLLINVSFVATAKILALKGNKGIRACDPHTCCLCQKVSYNRKALRDHLERVHCKSKKMFCDLCPKFYFTRRAIFAHMKVHNKKNFTCNICDYKTVFKSRLKTHKMTHSEKVECPTCKKPLSSLKLHMKNVHNHRKSCSTTYNCKDGERSFENREAFIRLVTRLLNFAEIKF